MVDKGASSAATRRSFLKESTAAAAIGALAIPRGVHADGEGTEAIKLGLVGCGARGEGAVVDALTAEPRAELVAMGDAFLDRAQERLANLKGMEGIKDRIKVTPDRVFADFDNFKHVIDSDVDVVLLATPPHFRPEHLAYAVDKGKHCFVEKPVGVDVPGVKSVLESCARAKEKGLTIISGLIWRCDPGVVETVKRIKDGAIGEIIAIQACYNGGTLWHRGDDPKWSRMEYQMRNCYYYTWLSGDQITEQAVHTLDKVCWLMDDEPPVSAFGLGGRQQRTAAKWGHIFDHHTVFYDFPNGKKCFFTCRQQDNVANFVDEIVLGTKGSAQLLAKKINGEKKWHYRGPTANPYVIEHQNLFKSVRDGAAVNQGSYVAGSTLVSIMGRMCTYTGQQYSWDQVMTNQERLGPAEYKWGDVPEPPVPVPGVTTIA